MRSTSKVVLSIMAALVVAGCGTDESTANGTPTVTIMTFNVENLFDNIDDPARNDETYVPLGAKQGEAHIAACRTIEVEAWRKSCLELDWNDATIEHKLSVVAESIRQIDDGRGPDVLALQEIENLAMLLRLRDEYLGSSGYSAILIEGDDVRGIDVAFLSRLPLVGEPTLHTIDWPAEFQDRAGDARGVLEATFELPDGSLLTGFAVHFPAPFHPRGMRELAYEHLNRLKLGLPATRHVFAAGDFNTTSTEDTRWSMLERLVRPSWRVSNDYCHGCPGTQYYARDDNWSFLDMILYSPGRGEKTTWSLRADSVQIANRYAAQVSDDGKPRRYDAAARAGVSDHWPVLIAIEATEIQ